MTNHTDELTRMELRQEQLVSERDEARTEIEALRAALGIYADLENWLDGTAGVFGGDGGRIAREALSSKE